MRFLPNLREIALTAQNLLIGVNLLALRAALVRFLLGFLVALYTQPCCICFLISSLVVIPTILPRLDVFARPAFEQTAYGLVATTPGANAMLLAEFPDDRVQLRSQHRVNGFDCLLVFHAGVD
jgi:hypothetical protein